MPRGIMYKIYQSRVFATRGAGSARICRCPWFGGPLLRLGISGGTIVSRIATVDPELEDELCAFRYKPLQSRL